MAPLAKALDQNDLVINELLVHSDALYNFALKLTSNKQDAEDLIQDTYFRAIKYKHYFEKGTKAKAWLFRIMQNQFINDYRKNSKIPKEFDVDTVYLGHHYSNNINSKMLNFSLSDDVAHAVNALDSHLKTALILCDVEGFNYNEIASVMDIPLGTVKTYIHKARKRTKEKLQQAMHQKSVN